MIDHKINPGKEENEDMKKAKISKDEVLPSTVPNV